jgi:mRNA-degrading endonuclease toxin of MazEF toxin-antitoxin module
LFHGFLSPYLQSTNLKTASVLQLHKLATIHASMIARHLGTLPQSQKTTVAAKLHDLLVAW